MGPVGTPGGLGAGADPTTQPSFQNQAQSQTFLGSGLQTPNGQGNNLSLEGNNTPQFGDPGAAAAQFVRSLIEPASHDYGFRWRICDAPDPGCSAGTAFGGGLRSWYAGADGQIARDGQIYYVLGWRDYG